MLGYIWKLRQAAANAIKSREPGKPLKCSDAVYEVCWNTWLYLKCPVYYGRLTLSSENAAKSIKLLS